MDRGVPFLYADKECIIGDKPIIDYLKSNVALENQALGDTKKDTVLNNEKKSSSQKLTLPVLIGASLADSINPCSFAVLIILMTTILASGRKKRALYSGLAFSLSIFISYLLMGLGLYSVIASFETSRVFMQIVGVLAILLGLFNLKDFFWYGKGFLMEVPLSWRPKLKSLLNSITNPIGAFFIGFLVSLFLLPCTSGPYIVIIGMLGNENTYANAIWLLVLYNLIFILPMLGITLGAYFGLDLQKAEKTRTKKIKYIHLITGIIMLGIGILLLLGVI
jgi:cytochrome c biogenesis protein CcdA